MDEQFATRTDGSKSRLQRRVEAAQDLAEDMAIDGQFRAAQIIRDLCLSALQSARTNSQLHADNAALRAANVASPAASTAPSTAGVIEDAPATGGDVG